MTTWLEHVKKVHAAGSTSFKESLKRASASWKKGAKTAAKAEGKAAPKKKRKKRRKAQEEEVEEKASTEQQAAPVKKKHRAKKNMPKIAKKAYKSVDSITV